MLDRAQHLTSRIAERALSARNPAQTNVEFALILFLVAAATAGALGFVGSQVQEMIRSTTAVLTGRIAL